MEELIERRKAFFHNFMKFYCKEHNIAGWSIKFVDINTVFGRDAGALCHKNHKTIYVNTNHLGWNVPPLWHRDAFLHEFVHLLNFEKCIELTSVGLDGYCVPYSVHGREFRKLAYKLGVGKQCIPPTYKE